MAQQAVTNFALIPAKKMTAKPAIETRMAVPRSGCFKMKATGTERIAKARR